jgi:hypothetical protein
MAPPPPPTAALNENGVPAGASAAQQLEAAQVALQGLQTRLTPQHPDVVRMKRIVADLQKKADAEALARPVSAGAPVVSVAELRKRNLITEMKAEVEYLRAKGTVARYTVEKGQPHRLDTLAGPNAKRLFEGFEETKKGCAK